jgi:hypothetical protein
MEKICFRCYSTLKKEEKLLDYSYYCENCNENFYEFETLTTQTELF